MKDKKTSALGEAAGANAETRCESNPPHRILVVDDDGDIRRLNTEALTYSGYQVDAAGDGAAAWDTLQSNSYDLLITDNNMPKLSGVELLKKLHAARMAVPVIMASGTMPKEEFIRYPWLQPAATLPKPFTGEELLGTVREVLRATHSACEPIEPPPTSRGEPSAYGAGGLML